MEASGKTPHIESIARDTRAPVATVETLYTQECEALSRDARITSFIPVLAESRVRHQLRLVKQPIGRG